jgi:CheY-like chemotaxis protein
MENTHILVVEDSEITLFKLKAILVRLGYKVTTYTSPLTALDWMSKPGGVPDLIISDVLMPDMNGYDFIHQVAVKTCHIAYAGHHADQPSRDQR